MDAAQALPGPQFFALVLLQAFGQAARLKLGGVADAHALRPVRKLLIIGAGQRPQQGQIFPPPLLDGLALGGKLRIQHFQHGAFFGIGALDPVCRMAQQRIFLLQHPHIPPVSGKVAGVQLAQGRVQKFAAALRRALHKAQVARVEHHSGEAARQARRALGRGAVHRGVAPRPLGIRRAHRDAHMAGVVPLLVFLPGPQGDGVQHRKCFPAAHKLSVLAAPEALAAGQQPDGFQQVRLALAVVAADDGQLPAGLQLCL